MGNEIVRWYKEKFKLEWKIAFLSVFFGFLIIHIYKFTNNLPNHDTLSSIYSPQNMTVSGRWFLRYACGVSSFFDLPWLNGLLSAIYLGITTIIVVETLGIHNPVVIILTGLILSASPATTETLFFEFTADGYFLGLLLSALAAYLSCKGTRSWHWLLSGVCLCVSCAVYQSYVSFAVLLCIIYLVLQLLNEDISLSGAWRWIGKHIAIYGSALALYYAIWKLILSVTGQAATNYQGIDEVGKITLSTLSGGIVKSIKNILFYFLEWNILEHPITPYGILNIFFFLSMMFILIVTIAKTSTHKKTGRLLMILFCLIASIPVVSMWAFVSDVVQYHPMMFHSTCLFYIFALILFNEWTSVKLSTLFGIFMAVIIFNFSVMANISYFYMDKCYEKTYYMGGRMMEQIEDVLYGEEEVMGIAFIGSRGTEVSISETSPGYRIHMLSASIEADFLYDHAHAYTWLHEKYGMNIPSASVDQITQLETHEIVKKMGTWPEKDAISVIDGILVVKLAESIISQ